MKTIAIALALAVLAGCASVTKLESGDVAVGERLQVRLDGPWNRVEAPGLGPAQTWTMEGLPVDQLLVYSGLKDGELIHDAGIVGTDGQPREFRFRAAMQPDEIVALFEGLLARDGSRFKLLRLEPAAFGGAGGFRFEYSLLRKVDNVELSGVGYGGVSKGELFAVVYLAPRLGFFARHRDRVESIARSAKIRI